jgi:phosphocarrier protein
MAKEISHWNKKPSKRLQKPQQAAQNVTIQNKLGLHARAAASFIKLAFQFQSDIELIKGDQRVNGKSIMGLLTLAASQGVEVTIEAEGSDSEEAVEALAELISNKFGED